MSITFFSAFTLSVVALLVVMQVYKGYKRGITDSLVALAIIVLSAFFAVPISTAVASLIEPEISILLEDTAVYDSILQLVGNVSAAISILVRMLVSLVLYLPVYIVMRLVLSIICYVILRLVFRKMGKASLKYYKENEALYVKKGKRTGACIGIVSGLLLSVVILTPVLGVLNAADDVFNIVRKFSGTSEFLESDEVKMVSECSDDFSVSVFGVMGADMLGDFATTVNMNGHKASLQNEIDVIKDFDIERVNAMLASLDTANAENVQSLDELLNYMCKSLVLKTVMVVYVNEASRAWLDGEDYKGTARPMVEAHASVNGFLNTIFYVCSTSTVDTIEDDITTLMNLLRIFNERREIFELGDYDAMIMALIDSGTTDLIKAELESNPHMRAVSYAIEDMIMTIVSEELKNTLKYTTEECDALFADFADILVNTQGLTGSVRTSAVSADIKEKFDEYGIYVPEELNDTIADLLINGVSGESGQPGFEDVQNFFNKYEIEVPEMDK